MFTVVIAEQIIFPVCWGLPILTNIQSCSSKGSGSSVHIHQIVAGNQQKRIHTNNIHMSFQVIQSSLITHGIFKKTKKKNKKVRKTHFADIKRSLFLTGKRKEKKQWKIERFSRGKAPYSFPWIKSIANIFLSFFRLSSHLTSPETALLLLPHQKSTVLKFDTIRLA